MWNTKQYDWHTTCLLDADAVVCRSSSMHQRSMFHAREAFLIVQQGDDFVKSSRVLTQQLCQIRLRLTIIEVQRKGLNVKVFRGHQSQCHWAADVVGIECEEQRREAVPNSHRDESFPHRQLLRVGASDMTERQIHHVGSLLELLAQATAMQEFPQRFAFATLQRFRDEVFGCHGCKHFLIL